MYIHTYYTGLARQSIERKAQWEAKAGRRMRHTFQTLLLGHTHVRQPQIRAITAHKYTPDRYLYKEGMALAARLEAEEAAAAAAGVDPLNPPTPVQQVGVIARFGSLTGTHFTPSSRYALHRLQLDNVFCGQHVLCCLSVHAASRYWCYCRAEASASSFFLQCPPCIRG
jgi:hypothetical protein